MPLARNEFIADGVSDTYPINFALGYISRSNVKAYVGTPSNIVTVSFIEDNLVRVSPKPAAGSKVVIYRQVPKATLIVDYKDGAVFTEHNLDLAQKQSIMLAHEALDHTTDAYNPVPGGDEGGGSTGPINIADVIGLTAALADTEKTANKNKANGYVGLTSDDKIPTKYLTPQESTTLNLVPYDRTAAAANQTKLLNAITAATDAGAGVVNLAAGTFYIGSKVDKLLKKGGITIQGQGPDVTRLVWPNADGGIHFTYPEDGWWFEAEGGCANLFGLSLITEQTNGGVGYSINGRTVGGRPMQPTSISRVRFRGSNADKLWTTAIDFLDTSLTRIDNVQVFNSVANQKIGTGLSIRSSGSGRDPVEHLIVNFGVTYGAAAVQAGDYVEGIQITNMVVVGTDYGVYWNAANTAESHLGLFNSHINARTSCIALSRVQHNLIQGNLFFIQDNNTSVGISLSSVGETDFSHNVLRGNGSNTGVYIEDPLNEMATRRLSIGRNVLAGFQTGYVIAANAKNVVLNETDQVFQQCASGIVNNSTSSLYPTSTAGVPEAPNDGTPYGRKNKAWIAVSTMPEAPTDGVTYGRKNGAWAAVSASVPRGGSFRHTAGTSLPGNTEVTVTWGAIDQQDNPGNTMSDGIFRAPEAGVYFLSASVNFTAGGGGDTKSFMFIKYNTNSTIAISECFRNGGSAGRVHASAMRYLNSGDTLTVTVNPGNFGSTIEASGRDILHVRKIG